jgi:hypothetical protein
MAPRTILPFTLAVVSALLSAPVLPAAGYRFIIPPVDADPGDAVRITIQGEHDASAQGFSIAARYPAADLTIERMHLEDTILEAIRIDFFEEKVVPGEGFFVVGVLVDSQAPFEGNLIPSIGQPLDFVHLEARVAANASGDLKIQLEDGLGDPPIENLYSVNNQAVPVTELTEGVVRVSGSGGGAGGFLRGDFNMDESLDISDPIKILEYAFTGTVSPPCLVAGDANDDDTVDVADPIYLLAFLFQHGRSPPPPSDASGKDPTPGRLGCSQHEDFP